MFKDYGILDLIKSTFSFFTQRSSADGKEYRKIELINDPNDIIWFIFLPWRVSFKIAKLFGLVPNKNYVAYEVSPSLINPNPHIAKETMRTLYKDFSETASSFKKVNLVSFSSSQYLAVYCANHCNLNKLILVCPGLTVGKAMWNSASVRGIKKKAIKLGYKSAEDYDKVLGDTNPTHQLRNLPKKIDIHLGSDDKYIPYQHGEKFIEMLQAAGKKTRLILHEGRGHITTMIEFDFPKDDS